MSASGIPSRPTDFVPRGVWKGPCPRDGVPTAIAVDLKGRQLAEIALHPGVDVAAVHEFLWRLVNAVDPQRTTLELVK